MSSLAGISSNIIKKRVLLYHYTTSSFSSINFPFQLAKSSNWTNVDQRYLPLGVQKIYQRAQYYYSTQLPGTSPPEFPQTAPPEFPQATPPEEYNVPLEVPQTPNVPDFDPISPEQSGDPPPLSPGENPGPGFPGPPNPSMPKPEAPVPPLSPPGQPEVVPPHGPEIMPSQPPDVPTPV